MTTTTSNPNLLLNSSNPLLKFKPYIAREKFLWKFSKAILCKRNYKYIHGFQADLSKTSFKILSKLKSLTSLSLSSAQRFKKAPLLKKLLKFHKKSLRDLSGGIETPRFQMFLPLLSRLTITNKPASWRLLVSRSAFTKLLFDFDPIGSFHESLDQKAIHRLFIKYQTALCRHLPKMKDLVDIEIKSTGKNIELILSMLEIINDKVNFESLKQLGLGIGISVLQNTSQDYLEKSWKIEKALQNMTSLSIMDAEKYSFFFKNGKLQNLSSLNLRYFPKEEPCDLSYLASFKDLVKLKKLTFAFPAKSFACCEMQFFKNFIIPASVENLNLDLINFTWTVLLLTDQNWKIIHENFESSPLYINFFERLQNCSSSVKTLDLSLTQSSHIKNCPALSGKFASLFFQRFSKLEAMSFRNSKTGPLLPDREDSFIRPFDLDSFWKALESSKETLISISINSKKIAFPEKIEALETRFPQLKKLTLKDQIICSGELGNFCCNTPNLKEITVQEFIIQDEKNLKELLFSLKDIPREMKVSLSFNVKEIKQQKLLIDCLSEYITQVKIKGMLQMHFTNVQAQDVKAFQQVVNLVKEKGCFETFSMVVEMNILECFYSLGQKML